MKRLIIVSLTLFLLLFTFPLGTGVYSQDTPDNDEVALENDLLLKIPEETDNPNYNLTFTDPSSKGVFISIDGGKDREITSPYQLPSLGIGRHTLTFKYTTEDEQESSYQTEVIIVPRPPEINPPEHTNNKLVINGSSLASSKLYLFLTGGGETFREIIEVPESREWEYIFENEFVDGIYTTTAYVTKNGYGSAMAEPITFTIGTTAGNEETEEVDEVGEMNFQLAHLMTKDVLNTYTNNTDLILYTVAILVIGMLLGLLLHRFLFVRGEKKLQSNFKKMLSGDKDEKEDEKSKKKDGEDSTTEQKAPENDGESPETGPDGPNANLYEEEFPPFQKDVETEEAEGEVEVVEEEVTEGEVAEEEVTEGEVVEDEAAEEEVVEEEVAEDEVADEEVVEEEVAEEAAAEEEVVEDEAAEEEIVEEEAAVEEEVAEEEVDQEEVVEDEAKDSEEEDGESSDEGPDGKKVAAAAVATEMVEGASEGKESKYGEGAKEEKTPKEQRKSVFSFLRRNKKEEKPKEEEVEEETEEETPVEQEQTEETTETEAVSTEELSREEFLEKFKQHDPDPEGEEKTGSMSEKVEEDSSTEKEENDDTEVEDDAESEAEEAEEDKSIEGMGLGTRVTNALIEAGYKSSDELEGMSKSELVNIDGIGLVAADEITDVLRGEEPPKKKSSKKKKAAPKKKKVKKPRKKPARRRNIKISLTSGD